MNSLSFGEDIFWKIMMLNTYQKGGESIIKLKDNLENKVYSQMLIKFHGGLKLKIRIISFKPMNHNHKIAQNKLKMNES